MYVATAPERIRALFGPDPDAAPPGPEFPRLPPGLMHPMTSRFAVPRHDAERGAARLLAPSLEDFQVAHQMLAGGLLGAGRTGIAPPGHPLHSRQASVSALRSENGRLLKENMELKKRLDLAT